MNEEKRILMVVSGGMDSVTALHLYKDDIKAAVSFNYGSNHNEKEIYYAKLNCEKLGIPHEVVDLRDAFKSFKSGLLSGAAAIPEGHYEQENMKHTVVPFRNGIMLSIAAGLAESKGLSHIMLASHLGDHAIYKDCRKSFSQAMEEAIKLGTDAEIGLLYPFADLDKRQIAKLGHDAGVKYQLTYSCYKGGQIHCGKCGTCVERIWALKGIDPTEYELNAYEDTVELLKEKGEW